ncbi:MAG: response regulator [Desulfobulbus sp.]
MITATKKIDGFSLENILQIFSLEKKTQTLLVKHDEKKGFIDIENGELINAEFNNDHGVDVSIEILSWEDIQVELLPFRNCQRTITRSLMNILMEASKFKDEEKNKQNSSGCHLLVSAIEKAEMQQIKEAYNDLAEYIKINRNDASAWIWYSRIQGNVGIMKKALKMAQVIAPEDALVQKEQEKFTAVAPYLTGDVARKCYFCWAPLNKQETVCHYCHGRLTISENALAGSIEMDSHYLEQARSTYLRILKKSPRNLVATYCLALIHLNSNNFQEALGYLDKATKMAPAKDFFANQLKILLNHLAKRSSAETIAHSNETIVAEPEKEATQSDKKLILVVEDSSTTRKVIAITLSRSGYRVNEAADGLEALSKISEERPDLIMLDVILPKMDGYKILAIVKGNKEFKEIPVIMLTSKDGFINKMKGKMAGSAAYLTKPFDPDKMITEIKKHI